MPVSLEASVGGFIAHDVHFWHTGSNAHRRDAAVSVKKEGKFHNVILAFMED